MGSPVSTPNNTLLFYNGTTGAAVVGTVEAGHWQQTATLALPTGYSHAAASRDSLLLYNRNNGTGETGTFKDGQYTRVNTREVVDDIADPSEDGEVLVNEPLRSSPR